MPDVHDRRQSHAGIQRECPHQQADGNGDHARKPVCSVLQEARAIAGEEQVRKKPRHEEGKRVEKGQDAEPLDRLPEKFRSERAGTCIGG
jgi:hypothetical protein